MKNIMQSLMLQVQDYKTTLKACTIRIEDFKASHCMTSIINIEDLISIIKYLDLKSLQTFGALKLRSYLDFNLTVKKSK